HCLTYDNLAPLPAPASAALTHLPPASSTAPQALHLDEPQLAQMQLHAGKVIAQVALVLYHHLHGQGLSSFLITPGKHACAPQGIGLTQTMLSSLLPSLKNIPLSPPQYDRTTPRSVPGPSRAGP